MNRTEQLLEQVAHRAHNSPQGRRKPLPAPLEAGALTRAEGIPSSGSGAGSGAGEEREPERWYGFRSRV